VFSPADQVHDEDEDDEGGEGCSHRDGHHVVGNFVLFTNFRFAKIVFAARHVRLHPQFPNRRHDVGTNLRVLGHAALEGISVMSVNAEHAVGVLGVQFRRLGAVLQSKVGKIPDAIGGAKDQSQRHGGIERQRDAGFGSAGHLGVGRQIHDADDAGAIGGGIRGGGGGADVETSADDETQDHRVVFPVRHVERVSDRVRR